MTRKIRKNGYEYTYEGEILLSYKNEANGVEYKCSGTPGNFKCDPVLPADGEWPRTKGDTVGPVSMIVDDSNIDDIKIYREDQK